MKKINFKSQDLFFNKLNEKAKLYIPKDTKNGAVFAEYNSGDTLTEELNTKRSAKDFFFPQTENMMDFKTGKQVLEIIDVRNECEDFIIFGVRACDFRSFDILDRVFLQDPVDTFYKNRRDHAVIITLACSMPEETCFCTNFGIDAANPGGDISAWRVNDDLYLNANTEKGKELLDSLELEDADEKEVDAEKEKTKKILDKLPLNNLPVDSFKQEKLMEIFKNPKWHELSRSCLGCGTCTFVCPTCQCFDIRDFDTGHGVKRYRVWDSCMYSDFTKMAAANPRLTQLERFRQRFMHKLVYYPANNDGIYGCVGCGRCLNQCPISMNIVKVTKEIGGGELDK